MITRKSLLVAACMAIMPCSPISAGYYTQIPAECYTSRDIACGAFLGFGAASFVSYFGALMYAAEGTLHENEAQYTQEIANALRTAVAEYVNIRQTAHFYEGASDATVCGLLQHCITQELTKLESPMASHKNRLIDDARIMVEDAIRSVPFAPMLGNYAFGNARETALLTAVENVASTLVRTVKNNYRAQQDDAMRTAGKLFTAGIITNILALAPFFIVN